MYYYIFLQNEISYVLSIGVTSPEKPPVPVTPGPAPGTSE